MKSHQTGEKRRYTALYERLSRDDELEGDSNSIVNQKMMLMDYAIKHRLPEPRHFTDDGISGTRFDRPGFNEMISEIKAGNINTVLVKDMSRLGRDYLKVGQLVEMFRQLDVRLIAVNDGTDTINGDDDFLPFRNIMNEWYAKDTSRKIKSTFRAKGNSGKHIASNPPYGYIKAPDDPNHWVIDKEAADIVKRVYRMTLEGFGPFQICKILEKEKIEIPAVHLKKMGIGNWQNKEILYPYRWNSSTVVSMLAKQEYLGHTVNFKTAKHFKDKRSHYISKNNWIVFENTQDSIIDEDTFNKVQKCRNSIKRYPNDWGEPHALDGKMFCYDCNGIMYCHRSGNGKRIAKYVCSNYGKQPVGSKCRSAHRIDADAVVEILKNTLKFIKSKTEIDPESLVNEIIKDEKEKMLGKEKKLKTELNKHNSKLKKIDDVIFKLYEDNALGKIPDNIYESLISKYNEEQEKIKSNIETIEIKLSDIQNNEKDVKRFVELINRYDDFGKITPFIVNEFVDKIVIHERSMKWSVNTAQEVDIYFNFIGNVKMPARELTEDELLLIEKKERQRQKNHEYYIKRKSKLASL